MEERLRAVIREITAVEAALSCLDAVAEQQQEDEDADESQTRGSPSKEQDETQRRPQEGPDIKLQHAGLAQRLLDLEKKQQQLQVLP